MAPGRQTSLFTRWSAPRLRSVLSAVPDAIVIVRPSGAVVPANRAARALLQPVRSGRIATGIHTVLPDYDPADPPLEPREMQAVRSDGSRFTAEVTSSIVGTQPRTLRVFVIRDISRRKRLEAALHARQEVLNRALRLAAAAEMSSAVTHELRQPIAAIRNYLHACRHLAADESRRTQLGETVGKALREAERAGSVLRRLQDYFQAGTTHPENLLPAALVRETLAALREHAERLSVSLRIDVTPSLPAIRVDRTQFETVLLNLVGNAIDAVLSQDLARPRRVVVAAVPDGEFLRFRVEDSGPGIARDVADALFQPFQTTKPEGMGLGLAISRTLVAANGGQLRLEWSGATGTCLSFTVRTVSREQRDG
jgi:two-component system sensor kinase FixL